MSCENRRLSRACSRIRQIVQHIVVIRQWSYDSLALCISDTYSFSRRPNRGIAHQKRTTQLCKTCHTAPKLKEHIIQLCHVYRQQHCLDALMACAAAIFLDSDFLSSDLHLIVIVFLEQPSSMICRCQWQNGK